MSINAVLQECLFYLNLKRNFPFPLDHREFKWIFDTIDVSADALATGIASAVIQLKACLIQRLG